MVKPGAVDQPRTAGAAYWAMMRRIVVSAAVIDAIGVALFAFLDSPFLSWLNVFSVGLYAGAYALLKRRRNWPAVALIWLEVLVHSALASMLIGWDSGFHLFLLMFIPAIVVGSPRRWAAPMVAVLLVFYLALETACANLGPLSPLQPGALQLVQAVNSVLIFVLFYAMASYYRSTVLKAERRLFAAATTDALTGLVNRNQFQALAQSELARQHRNGSEACLVLVDIDHFKRINDSFGHAAGDQVLVRVAQALRQGLRQGDVLARWGGEEFLALLPATAPAAAAALAERLRQAVAALPVMLDGQTLSITVSLGVAPVGADADLQPATAQADRALYASKRAGRNRVSLAAA